MLEIHCLTLELSTSHLRITSKMEEVCLPFELVGYLKLSKVKGTPDYDIQNTKDTVEVTLRWKRANLDNSEPSAKTKLPTTPMSFTSKTEPIQETATPRLETTSVLPMTDIVFKQAAIQPLSMSTQTSPVKSESTEPGTTDKPAVTTPPETKTPASVAPMPAMPLQKPREPYEGNW